MKAKVVKIDQYGLVEMKFYKAVDMQPLLPITKENFTAQSMNISMHPAPIRLLSDDKFDTDLLEINEWTL